MKLPSMLFQEGSTPTHEVSASEHFYPKPIVFCHLLDASWREGTDVTVELGGFP